MTTDSNQKPKPEVTILQRIGRALIVLAILGFALTIILSFTVYRENDNGAIPAISFLFIMIGIAFVFPDLLEDESGGLSTMRIVVLITVLAFAVITIKIAWQLKTFDEWRIDHTWIYILGLAFGAKAWQKYNELEGKKSEAGT